MDTMHQRLYGSDKDILDYLRTIPGYPFDDDLDEVFVEELVLDFAHVDILEQIKAFRWYHHGDPAENNPNLRLAIRRWLANARY